MDVSCPYCAMTVDVTSLEQHVRMLDGDGHGAHGTVPVDGVDNPWNLRLDTSDAPAADGDVAGGDLDDALPPVEVVADARRGRCPACEFGVLGFKGGDGWFSSGRRRFACPTCGWESPEWLKVRN